MDIILKHFGKPKHELKLSDIEKYFITEKYETDTLEFKSISSHAFEKQLIKLREEICAFLNSGGGLIILGAPQGITDPNSHKKKFIGDLTTLTSPIEKDRFINMVTDKISPMPNGVILNEYYNSKGFIYLIEVHHSEYAPHQLNGTYYMRLDGQIKPAPHHYVEALIKKVKFPDLEGYLMLKNLQYESDFVFTFSLEVLILNWSFYLNEEDLHYRIHCSKVSIEGEKGFRGYLIVDNAKKLLPYGENLSAKHKVKISRPLRDDKELIGIQLVFGGKLSPLRVSTYEFSAMFVSAKEIELKVITEQTSIWAKDFLDEKGVDREKAKKSFVNVNRHAVYNGKYTSNKKSLRNSD